MRLLFDENLSPRLVEQLADCFPASQHVDTLGLHGQPDFAIWETAGKQGLVIVSKDNDFRQLSFLHGPPPKVVSLSVGNGGTKLIANLLRRSREVLLEFEGNSAEGLLILDLTLR